jgi:plasmid stabilization system protein ParE
MKFDVLITGRAERDLKAAARWWAENRSRSQAELWYKGFVKAICGLSSSLDRSQLAPESVRLPFELRQLHYGLGRNSTHRAVFVVRRDIVMVLAIRHLAQGELELEDLL